MDDQTLYRPWGVVDPGFWADSEPEKVTSPGQTSVPVETAVAAVSGEVADQLAAIQAAASVDLARANVLAEELDAKTTASHGEGHIETVRIREVRAYLAHLAGHQDSAVAWYLHVVHLHTDLHGPEHPETVLAVRRAYSMWKALPAADAVGLAQGLIEAFAKLPGAGAEAVPRMREHLRRLQQSSDGQVVAAQAEGAR